MGEAVSVDLYLGDCLEILPNLEDRSIDAIITDLPYGTTACKWDEIIPFDPMWKQVKRLLKDYGVFITTATQPFASKLIMSNIKWFKYEWIWNKMVGSNFQLANKMPLRSHENVLVFSLGRHNYYPQKTRRKNSKDYRNCNYQNLGKSKNGMNHFASKDVAMLSIVRTERFPLSVIEYSAQAGETNNVNRVHPTQKPITFYEYLINTYTKIGDIVLDFCMGSGSCGVAAIKINRNFIGIEIEPKYFEIAKKRIAEQVAV